MIDAFQKHRSSNLDALLFFCSHFSSCLSIITIPAAAAIITIILILNRVSSSCRYFRIFFIAVIPLLLIILLNLRILYDIGTSKIQRWPPCFTEDYSLKSLLNHWKRFAMSDCFLELHLGLLLYFDLSKIWFKATVAPRVELVPHSPLHRCHFHLLPHTKVTQVEDGMEDCSSTDTNL